MDKMRIVSMSDLHLGSPASMHRQFRSFLRKLPDGCVLIMNGDVVDVERRQMPREHEEVLSDICAASFRLRIVWTGGNHDKEFVTGEPNRIEFAHSWNDGRIFFSHGDAFMPMLPLYRAFNKSVRFYRALRSPDFLCTVKLAKSMPAVFRILKKASAAKALRYARKHGYKTVVCGHLHEVMDLATRGGRYINTGSWTEWPAYFLIYENGTARLVQADGD
ncbi:MAG: metallophosphoesterase family protein [bacterium]